ncbi:MAG TPA: lysophospholipid acyltransferase family protein [Xanthobacteraceae bacterium]|nr:lysophospholipid acyltransferase family protein [Xanthobacteraceae bacterium]
MALWKRIGRASWVQTALGVTAAEYLRLVWYTSRFVVEPADFYDRVEPELPVIFAFWHGQHFMIPLLKPKAYPAKALISRHRDGEMNAIATERLGIGAIRGSGDHTRRFDRKGGVSAFLKMLTALENDWSMGLTADIPKVSRVVGIGIVKLAQASGRPIFPVAIATSGRITLGNWDRSVINLPFSRGALVGDEPVRVAPDADADALERARRELEDRLNAATARAYTLVDTQGRRHG